MQGETTFRNRLLKWNNLENQRSMPWKGEKDPYRIWLSEIILQQTRVEQGLLYYEKFVSLFPDVHSLANADPQVVYKAWEGLGYYSRCKNLIASANYISKELYGSFPSTYDSILSLKGIGPYTAAAIASFAFNLPFAVVDGNVYRVLARFFGITLKIDNSIGKKYFQQIASELLDKKQPGIYNQAIMDFGAMICKPAPNCKICPLRKSCFAFNNNAINELPARGKKVQKKSRWFHYIIFEHDEKFAIRKRTEKDIWHNLFDYFLVESEKKKSADHIISELFEHKLVSENDEIVDVSTVISQQLTHQHISGRFVHLRVRRKPALGKEWKWVGKSEIKQFPFPRFINTYHSICSGKS